MIKRINRRSVFYGVFAISVSNVILQVLGFIYRIFLSRTTGAEGIGLYQLVLPFYSVLMSLSLTGMTVAVSRISAEKAAENNLSAAKSVVYSAFRLFLCAVAVLAAITLTNSSFIAEKLLGDVRSLKSFPFLLICLTLTGFENIMKAYFYGVLKVAPQITAELSEQVVRFASVFLLFFFLRPETSESSVSLIILGMIISELVSCGILFLFFRPKRAAAPRGTSSKLVSIAASVSAAATLNTLLSSANAVLIPRRLIASGLSAASATEAFGVIFGMVLPLLTFPVAFVAALTSVIVPKLSEGLARKNLADVRRKACKAIHSTSLLASPFLAILATIGAPLSEAIFAHNIPQSYMLILCIGTLFSYFETTGIALLNAIGLEKRAMLYVFLGGVLQLFFTYLIGFPRIGIWGFVVGSLVSNAFVALLSFKCLVSRLKIRPNFENWFFTPLLAAAFCGVISKLSYDFLLPLSLSRTAVFILSIAVGLFSYRVSLSALGTSITRYIKTLQTEHILS